jgi:hypothetical protein
MFQRTPHVLFVLAVIGALLALRGAPAAAQSSSLDKLSVHGFLTQSYGISDGHQYLGIPSYGTAAYRVAALQFRYDPSDRDAFVLQLSHERLGRSPLNDFEPAVDMDWVFYERRFGDNTVARVGKIRSPVGIYNEIRDVGTLLPLYRPPVALYGEQLYSSETVDGVTLGHYRPLGDWRLDIEGFFGSWDYVQWDRETLAEVDGGLGTQIWLHTPIEGLRLGAAAIRFSSRNVAGAPEDLVETSTMWRGTVDGTFRRLFVRAEGYHTGFGDGPSSGYDGNAQGYYGQVGFNVSDEWSLITQAEFTDIALDVYGPQPFSLDENIDRDLGLGLQYRYAPNLVFKLEGHRYRGYGTEDRLLLMGLDDPEHVTMRAALALAALAGLSVTGGGATAQEAPDYRVVVHPNSLVDALTADEISKMFLKRSTQIFSGRAVPPPELHSDELVTSYVSANPGAIGYVSPGTDVREIRVVEVRR